MKLKAGFIVIFSLLLLPIKGMSQNADETYQLADQFFAQEQYEEALYYFQRAAFFSQASEDSEILGKIADCFYATGDYNRALEYYDHAYFSSSENDLRYEFLFSKIATYLEQGNYHSALVELLGINSEKGTELNYRKELYLGAAYFGLEKFHEAGQHFIEAVDEKDLEGRKEIEKLYTEPKNFTKPNPKLAWIMSIIIPGSGQLYAGDPGAAINSLMLTGAFVGLVLYLSVRVHPIDAILTGLPWFQRYYQGGFDHAEQTAEDERERRRNLIYHKSLSIIASGSE